MSKPGCSVFKMQWEMDTRTMGVLKIPDKLMRVSCFTFNFDMISDCKNLQERYSLVHHCFPELCDYRAAVSNLVLLYFHIVGDRCSGKILTSGIAESKRKYTYNLVKYCQIPFRRVVPVCIPTSKM